MTPEPHSEPELEPQEAGYLLVATPVVLRRRLEERHRLGHADAAYVRHLVRWQAELGLVDAWRYRGVDRQALPRAEDVDEAEHARLRQHHADWIAFLRRAAANDPTLTPDDVAEIERRLRLAREAGEDVSDPAAWLRDMADRLEDATPVWAPEPGRHTIGTNRKAQCLLADLLGPDPTKQWTFPDGWDQDLLPDVDDARAVFAACRDADDLELIRIARLGCEDPTRVLGYDVACWGGDRLSALRECLVAPQSAPPAREALEALRGAVLRLNEHVLFPRADDAQAFADWYRAQP